ncbi:MAG: DNA-formamidopyrimidine glycosylase [Bacillota bacterium]
MPELPEVETIRRQLNDKITGLTIIDCAVYLEKTVRKPSPEVFRNQIRGRKILGVSRRGKYLLFSLDGGYSLIVHLRMTGQLIWENDTEPLPRHTHLVFHLDRGRLRLTDLRQFARVSLLAAEECKKQAGLDKLGPEPLESEFSENYLAAVLQKSRRRLKPLLLEQQTVAGVGNIYADESLYRAGLHPNRVASDLSIREASALYSAIKEVLQEGIAHRGTSLRNYVDADGREGTHQDFLKVHGRAGRPCPRCNTPVQKIRLGGRGTYFCPECQKEKL